jgi:surface antigen
MVGIVGARRSIYRTLSLFVVACLVGVTLVATGGAPAASATSPSPWATTWNTSALDFSGFNPGNQAWWRQLMCGNTRGFNCTNYVAYRLSANGVDDFLDGCGQTTHSGNAHTWNDKAALCGIRVDREVAPGSVIVFEAKASAPGGGAYTDSGHVAYVDAVEGNLVYISEASCGAGLGHRAVWDTSFILNTPGVSVIHPKDLGPIEPPPIVVMPPGPIVKTADLDTVYVVAGGAKYVLTPAEYAQLGYPTPQIVDHAYVDALGVVPRDGTFVKDVGSVTIYQVIGGAKYPVPDWATFEALGGAVNNYTVVPTAWLGQFSDGAPNGVAYMRDYQTGDIYQVINGAKYKYLSWPEYVLIGTPPYTNTTLGFINRASLAYPSGTTYLRDATSQVIYEVVNGTKRSLTGQEWVALSRPAPGYWDVSPNWLAKFTTLAASGSSPQTAPALAEQEAYYLTSLGVVMGNKPGGGVDLVYSGAKDFDVSGTLAVVLTDDGALRLATGGVATTWQQVPWEGDPIADVKIDGTRLLVLDTKGGVWVRDGLLSGNWSNVVASGATAIDADAGRVGYLTADRKVYVAEDATLSTWVLVHDTADEFALAGNRVAVRSGSTLFVKAGGLGADWITVHVSASDFAITDTRILVLTGTDLVAKEGPLTADWVTLATSVRSADASDGLVTVVSVDGSSMAKWGVIGAAWTPLASGYTKQVHVAH